MRNTGNNILIITLLSCFLQAGYPAFAQINAKVIRTINFPDTLHPTGNFQIMDDSLVLLPSNGGVFNLSLNKWHISPDSQRVVLSYYQASSSGPAFLTAFNRSTSGCALYKRTLLGQHQQFMKITDVAQGGMFRVNALHNALFAYGTDETGFSFFECRQDSLFTVLHTDKHRPSYVALFNRSTFLFSVGSIIYSCTRSAGLRKVIECDEPVVSFAVIDETSIIVSTRRGLTLKTQDGESIPVATGSFGEIVAANKMLYCMLWNDRKLKVVKW